MTPTAAPELASPATPAAAAYAALPETPAVRTARKAGRAIGALKSIAAAADSWTPAEIRAYVAATVAELEG
jgi:hypothetical protein